MRYLGVFIIMVLSANVYGQDKDTSSSFLDIFTLRKSFESKNDKAEPAIFTYTKPKDKDDSWLLNAAIGFNILPNTKHTLTLDPYFEYHKNTLIDKEQDNWQTGFSFEWQTQNLTTKSWSPIIISAIKYNEDKIKEISSFQGNLYFTPLFKGKEKELKYFWIPNNTTNFGDLFDFVFSPYVGLENENRIKTENDSLSGNIYRAYFRITSSVSLFPKSKKLKEKFEFNVDWQYRYNLNENVEALITNEHKYFTAGFNYVFFTADEGKKSAKIGIDYTNGENPTKNFEEQSYYALTLKVKL